VDVTGITTAQVAATQVAAIIHKGDTTLVAAVITTHATVIAEEPAHTETTMEDLDYA
jgi:hypothetical protein